MYYIVNQAGATEGPYAAEWIRANARPETLVSFQQKWLLYTEHPDFGGLGDRPAATTYSSPRPAISIDLSALSDWLLIQKSLVYLASGVACCTLLLMATQAFLGRASASQAIESLRLSLIWVVVFAILLVPAYGFGRLFGGKARLSEVLFGFSRSIAMLYLVIPLSLFLCNVWFERLRQENILMALVVILVFMFFVPLICLVFAGIGIRVFVRSMAFRSPWQAWATVISATAVTVIACLFLGDWFSWFNSLR